LGLVVYIIAGATARVARRGGPSALAIAIVAYIYIVSVAITKHRSVHWLELSDEFTIEFAVPVPASTSRSRCGLLAMNACVVCTPARTARSPRQPARCRRRSQAATAIRRYFNEAAPRHHEDEEGAVA
jgi:hypothetical protein